MKNKLFGTDGVRGVANTQISAKLAFNLAKAVSIYLSNTKPENEKPKVVIGEDTRVSCDMIRSALCAGLNSMGVDVVLAGVIPTPAINYLVKEFGFDIGIMITASHNSSEYNGIKITDKNGFKLTDEQEDEITEIFEQVDEFLPCAADQIGTTVIQEELQKYWADYIVESATCSLNGLRVGLDCANGASFKVAPYIFKKMGATVVCFNCEDKGEKINFNCGANYPQFLELKLKEQNLDIAFAFDGDADRVCAIKGNGERILGDEIMFLMAKYFKKKNKLNQSIFATTILTNFGFDKSLNKFGIKVKRVDVGGKSLQKIMENEELNLAGEDNGHIIIADVGMCSDGILSAIYLCKMLKEGVKFEEELKDYIPFYQTKINVPVSQRQKQLNKSAKLLAVISELEEDLGQDGRIVVRPSGTEMVIRVLVEGVDKFQVEKIAKELTSLIEKL